MVELLKNKLPFKLILYSVEAGEMELINTCVVPIAELGQKCLEAASTLKYEPLNSYFFKIAQKYM